ncbi:GMC oxidoreductase [Luteococcus sp. OSA5]|uniref:GMC oxidoreductase n=1 Tax=Luteococcus sp. OSA5 TaxID=3401630 RepID=UPI003B4357B9
MTITHSPSRRGLLGALATAPVLAGLPSRARADEVLVEHLVIGAGYGGAVLAERLTAAGKNVVMLEMGHDWARLGEPFTKITAPDWRSMWFRDRTALPLKSFLGISVDKRIDRGPGVLDRMDFGGMSVYCGRGVGGGSLVNGAIAVSPRRGDVEERLGFLDVDRFFDVHLPRARAGLGVKNHDEAFIDSSPWYQFSRVAKATAERAAYQTMLVPTTYDPQYLKDEAAGKVPGSATAGELIFGNNHGKLSLDKTYLARARATGRLLLRSMTKATTLTRRAAGGWLVTLEQVNADGSHTEQTPIAARRVYLAAGSVGTPELLLRSRAQGLLPQLPEAVGKGWGPNGNVMVSRSTRAWEPVGAKQPTIAVHGIDAWTGEDKLSRVFAEVAPLPAGVETWLNLYLAVTDNPNRGQFGWDAANNRLTLDYGPSHAAPSVAAVKHVFDDMNSVAGTRYRTDLFANGTGFASNFTYHPLGGAVIGQATDLTGQLLGHDGVYIADGSLVPGALGVNPFVTITALAEMVAEHAVLHADA